jgi:hypothetical protein
MLLFLICQKYVFAFLGDYGNEDENDRDDGREDPPYDRDDGREYPTSDRADGREDPTYDRDDGREDPPYTDSAGNGPENNYGRRPERVGTPAYSVMIFKTSIFNYFPLGSL